MGDQPLPLLAGRRLALVGHLEQGKVDAVLVAAYKPGPHAVELTVVRVVFVVLDPRRHAGKGFFRVLGIECPRFAGGLAVEQQDQLAFGTRAIAVQEETSVGLIEDFVHRGAAQVMTVQLVRTMGVIKLGKEQGLAVIGPGHAAVAVVEGQFANSAADEFLHIQAVNLVTAGVEAVGQALVVGADIERTQRQEAPSSQLVGVEQQFFEAFIDSDRVVGRTWAAIVAWILVACGGTGVVQVGAPG
ncbi:hypothetical protein D3C80_1017240 [compost metagenome]